MRGPSRQYRKHCCVRSDPVVGRLVSRGSGRSAVRETVLTKHFLQLGIKSGSSQLQRYYEDGAGW